MLDSKGIKTLLKSDTVAIGVSLDNKGLKAVLINKQKKILAYAYYLYKCRPENPSSWREGLILLIKGLPPLVRSQLVAITINCSQQGVLKFNSDDESILKDDYLLINSKQYIDENSSKLLKYFNDQTNSSNQKTYLFRQKSDWLMGWLLGNMHWGEESNNMLLGWNIKNHSWISWPLTPIERSILPELIASGTIAGSISTQQSSILGLPDGCLVIASTIEDNAAMLMNSTKRKEGLALLHDRLTLKCYVESPLVSIGIINYRIYRSWCATGVSRTGLNVLKQLFSEHEIKTLSHQINPSISSGLYFYPLLNRGEEFPIHNLKLDSILEPRPISDSLYLHGIIESLSYIESQGWKKMEKLSSNTIDTVMTMGYGIKNPQWQSIRKNALNKKIIYNHTLISTTGLAILALNGFYRALRIS